MPPERPRASRHNPRPSSGARDGRTNSAPSRNKDPRQSGPCDGSHAWRACTKLANRQKGIVSHPQLLAEEVDRRTIKRWTRNGSLHRLHHRVYAVGHLALAAYAPEQAALLACGEGTLLSHATAAYLWGLMPVAPTPVHLTLIGRQTRPKPGIRIHRVGQLDARDVRRRHGLPVTSPSRTMIDMAAEVNLDRLEELISEARVRSLIGDGELERALERAGRTAGLTRMREFLAAENEPVITRSRGERILRRLLTQARLPHPKFNTSVEEWSVDCLWQQEKLVVEFDGYRYHGHRWAFERDRRKDVALADLGYQVLRFTWRQLENEPFAVIASIARALDRRRAHAH